MELSLIQLFGFPVVRSIKSAKLTSKGYPQVYNITPTPLTVWSAQLRTSSLVFAIVGGLF